MCEKNIRFLACISFTNRFNLFLFFLSNWMFDGLRYHRCTILLCISFFDDTLNRCVRFPLHY